jgi:ParB family chromosome partitioning protein
VAVRICAPAVARSPKEINVLSISARPYHWFDNEARPSEPEQAVIELTDIDTRLIGFAGSALRRAELLAVRKRVYEALHPGSRHGGAPGRAGGGKTPRAERMGSAVRSHAADAAGRTGLSERSVRQLVQIAEDIPEPMRDLIRDTPLAWRQRALLEVARAFGDPEEQRRRLSTALGSAEVKDPPGT